jgi:hypothetical protein
MKEIEHSSRKNGQPLKAKIMEMKLGFDVMVVHPIQSKETDGSPGHQETKHKSQNNKWGCRNGFPEKGYFEKMFVYQAFDEFGFKYLFGQNPNKFLKDNLKSKMCEMVSLNRLLMKPLSKYPFLVTFCKS